MLTRYGMITAVFSEPQKALEHVQAGAAYDVFLLDMQMPEMSGDELAVAIRACIKVPAKMVLISSIGRTPYKPDSIFDLIISKLLKKKLLSKALPLYFIPMTYQISILKVHTLPQHFSQPLLRMRGY
jgi:CheY-like chemotaxis protein